MHYYDKYSVYKAHVTTHQFRADTLAQALTAAAKWLEVTGDPTNITLEIVGKESVIIRIWEGAHQP